MNIVYLMLRNTIILSVTAIFICSSPLLATDSVTKAAPQAAGVTGYATIVKLESDGKVYKITELHAINNEASPSQTQNIAHDFEFYLPEKAAIESVIAVGPSGRPVTITPAPVKREAGLYAIPFPLRPGMTRYAIRYHLPYSEELVFHPRLNYPTRQLSVVLPKSMSFTAPGNQEFHRIIDQDGVQVYALSGVKAGTLPSFTVSGAGKLPQNRTATREAASVPGGNSQPAGSNFGKSGANTSAQVRQWILWDIVAALIVIPGISIVLVRRRRRLLIRS